MQNSAEKEPGCQMRAGLKHHIVEIRGDVTMRDGRQTTNKQVKIELLSQWKLEAEFRDTGQ